jgi:hypothetical protein
VEAMASYWREGLTIGVFFLLGWMASEGDSQVLRWLGLICTFAVPALMILWWEYRKLSEKYEWTLREQQMMLTFREQNMMRTLREQNK